MSPVHRIRTRSATGTSGGTGTGPCDPDLSDSFHIGIRFAESNSAPTDAVSVGFRFPESNAEPTDGVRLSIAFPDSNATPTDSLPGLRINFPESNAEPTDTSSYLIRLLLGDTNAEPTDGVKISLNFPESNSVPTDARSGLANFWLSGSAGAGTTNPANANNPNDGSVATISTAVAGAATETLTSNVGSGIAAATLFTTAVYVGWFRLQTTLATSTAKVVMHSSSALFADITMDTLAANGGDTNRLTTPLTFDLIAAGVNTLAKLQSCQVLHVTTDAVAGVSPAIITADAGAIQLAGVLG